MIRQRKFYGCLLATIAVISTPGVGQAACAATPAGTWYFFAFQGHTPDITTTTLPVRTGPAAGTTDVTVFQSSGAYQNSTANVIKCVITIATNGNFSADPCSYYGVTPGESGTTTVGGHFTVAACNITGTINVGGDPTPVTIQAGHINGNSAAGIATQGAKAVMYYTLTKK
jgi:hypothetical protein